MLYEYLKLYTYANASNTTNSSIITSTILMKPLLSTEFMDLNTTPVWEIVNVTGGGMKTCNSMASKKAGEWMRK